MNEKNNILEAWIMVEHLAEGDIKLSDKELKTFEIPADNDFYSMFCTEIKNKGGLVLYFDIFPFNDVIHLLREVYKLSATDEEISVGNKFSFAIYFDKYLKLVEDMIFFTESYYILKNRCVPREKDFLEFEGENKKAIGEIFSFTNDCEYNVFFNNAFTKLLNKYSIKGKKNRMKALRNLETDATNLHSFFVSDLEKAKNIKTRNLDAYILGKGNGRINLDSKKTSLNFIPNTFLDILQPQNYPVARFPSNPKFALSLMQQVAVNLAIGYDNEQIRSVNGPPGTGKTTLLKDIFAELVVEQAYEIAKLTNKVISESYELTHLGNEHIGIMPETLADKGIVVASSNNGAVRNIVNELPLISGIDSLFAEDLRNADYFREISNSKIWVKEEPGNNVETLICEPYDEEKTWGLFSLEGGKKDNMNYIITTLKHVVSYLEKEYEPDDEVYNEFLKSYQMVCEYKKERQSIAEEYVTLEMLREQLKENCKKYEGSKEKLESDYNILAEEYDDYCIRSKQQLAQIEEQLTEYNCDLENNANEKDSVNQAIQALKLQKPSFFARRKVKQEYKERMRSFSEHILALLEIEKELNLKKADIEREKNRVAGILKEEENKLYVKKRNNEEILQSALNEIKEIEEKIRILSSKLQECSVEKLNMYVDYDSLQLSNPWYNDEYRVLQSKLFIDSLKVRKQFLYENQKSIKAAYYIWTHQKEYIDKKQVIAESWNWINMVIPVISSTFASFSRMCANLPPDSLGYLFVDEAGQALPQASVGAIFRSKQVMVVGDPAQIKPVLTLDSSILSMLGSYYGVSAKYLSASASTQTLVDEISKYGFYKAPEEWIGIPLWVHRRCKNPMFNISNAISYGGNMVQSTDVPGKACWHNVSGSASDKYVKEQGDFLKETIQELKKHNPDVMDTTYVISPFKNVAYQLSQELKEIGFTRYGQDGKPTNVGTVHTFQGKEAPIVFFVLGCDEKSRGAASWAVGSENPNIMNVAATRAKEEFYIIGDQKLFMSINSDVIKETCKILKKFNEV